MTIPPFIHEDYVAVVFAQWCAQPFEARDPQSIQELAKVITLQGPEEVTSTRLINLYNQVWWVDFVETNTAGWTPGFSRWTTDQVIEAIARKATKGDVAASKVYLAMAGVFDGRIGAVVPQAEELDPSTVPLAEIEAMTGQRLFDHDDEDDD